MGPHALATTLAIGTKPLGVGGASLPDVVSGIDLCRSGRRNAQHTERNKKEFHFGPFNTCDSAAFYLTAAPPATSRRRVREVNIFSYRRQRSTERL